MTPSDLYDELADLCAQVLVKFPERYAAPYVGVLTDAMERVDALREAEELTP